MKKSKLSWFLLSLTLFVYHPKFSAGDPIPGSELPNACPTPHESCTPQCGQECTYWKCANPDQANISVDRLPFSYILQNANCTNKQQSFNNYTNLPFTPAVPSGRPSPAAIQSLQQNPRVSLGTWACLQKWNGFKSFPTHDPGGGSPNGGTCCTLANYIDDNGTSYNTGTVAPISLPNDQRCRITCASGFVRTGQNSTYPETTGSCVPSMCNDTGRWGEMTHNATKPVYSQNTPAGPCSNVSSTIKCRFGTITGAGANNANYPYTSCSDGCLVPWTTSNYITHGRSVLGYSSSTPAGPCSAVTRSCSNGTLDNSTYSYGSCTNGCTGEAKSWTVGGRACSASTSSQSTGQSSTASVDGGQTSNSGSATFSCTNGTWGAPQSASCTIPWTLGSWVGCDACTKGYGTQSGTETRSVTCDAGNTAFCTGSPSSTQSCTRDCGVAPNYTYSLWSVCSATCGGTQTRTESCNGIRGICNPSSIQATSQPCGPTCPVRPSRVPPRPR